MRQSQAIFSLDVSAPGRPAYDVFPLSANTFTRTANPAVADEVEVVLGCYLATRLQRRVSFQALPEEDPNGWEAHTYSFQLQQDDELPDEYGAALVARIYGDPRALERARREYAALRYVSRWGYPTPVPLLLEEDCQYFGGPFLILTRVAGTPVLDKLLRRPGKIFTIPRQMARTHAWLHRLPTSGFPCPDRPFLRRRLQDIEDTIHVFDFAGLAPGLAWLKANCPSDPDLPCLLHLDFHPVNLLATGHGKLSVLDWTEADVGDLHADVGTALMMMECMPAGQSGLRRWLVYAGRPMLCRRYLRAYRRQMPLDLKKLAYYRALAGLWRLCGYGRWLRAGPEISGCKPASIRHLTPHHICTLQRYFLRWSGVAVKL